MASINRVYVSFFSGMVAALIIVAFSPKNPFMAAMLGSILGSIVPFVINKVMP